MSNSTGQTVSLATRLTAAANALLPRDCLLCAAASDDQLICPACRDALPRMPTDCCPVCALPTPGASICGACLKRPPRFDASHAVFRYEFPVDSLIHALKYGHRLASADFFAATLLKHPVSQVPDLVLPVPLAPGRLAERGFNQALEIARRLARHLGAPLETAGIRRQIDTTPQASLPWKERAKNIRHAFDCGIDLTGKCVLVVDDVMTTGATLNELAGTLKACGAEWVENRVLARALRT